MKKFLLAIICTVLFTSHADAQYLGLNPTDWKIYTTEKGEVTETSGGVVFSGKGMKTGYRLNLLSKVDKDKTVIDWYMSFKEFYAIYVEVYTTKGKRVLRYTSLDKDIGKKNGYINFGLGSKSRSSALVVSRDLQKDLDKFDKGNKIISITAFMVKGSGEIGQLETFYPYGGDIWANDEIIIEDGEESNLKKHWSIFTKDKGTIEHSYYKYNRAGIKLSGNGMKTGYALSFPTLKDGFNTVGWDMNYSENYAIYFLVNTNNGVKYLRYSSLDYDKGIHGRYISFGLGAISKDGKWHAYRRNLQKDLNKFEPNSKILSIQSFMIRGSGLVDNIKAIRDSSLIPAKNFDSKKFNKLLNIFVDNVYHDYGIPPDIRDTRYENIKYIYFTDVSGDNDSITLYTLSSDQKLKYLFSFHGEVEGVRIDGIKLNSDHTKMTIYVGYGATPKSYEHEVFL